MTTYPAVPTEKSPLEHPGDAGDHDERSGHLEEDGEWIRDGVAIVRGGEPGEVHLGPPYREEDHREAEEALCRVAIDDRVVEAGRALGDGDDDGEVEEEFERGGGAVGFGG